MIYIQGVGTDPHVNLAFEQHVFDKLDRKADYFLLWQNDNAIIVGKHQNTVGEINGPFVQARGISVVRRLSGGGAVYHDMGNLNFTFIMDAGAKNRFDFTRFAFPVLETLKRLGVHAELTGRNDLLIEGKKFSGNAQYIKEGRVMHHGTLMFDSDLDTMSEALRPADMVSSRARKSVLDRVTNIREHLPQDMTLEEFRAAMLDTMFAKVEEYTLRPEDMQAIEKLRREVYGTWEWNYGKSPEYTIKRQRHIEGVGQIQAHMDVTDGKITGLAFTGSYFAAEESAPLAEALLGTKANREALLQALEGVAVGKYFAGADAETLVSVMVDA